MANRVHAFRDRDIKRVIHAARAAGLAVDQVSVDPHSGVITVGPSKPDAPSKALDEWQRKRDAGQA
jgi:hypothetical protein